MLLAEIGPDMSRFPTDAHLVVGRVCPGQRGSSGKSTPPRRKGGSKWLRGTLTESPERSCAAKAPTSLPASTASRAAADTPKRPRDRPQDPHRRCHVLDEGVPYDELGEEFASTAETPRTPNATAAASSTN